MAAADKTPRPNKKRKDKNVVTCDASRCRERYRGGFERANHPWRRQCAVAKNNSGAAGRSKENDSAEPGGRGLYRQLGNRRAGQRVHRGEESERRPEVAAPDKKSARPSSDHHARHGL